MPGRVARRVCYLDYRHPLPHPPPPLPLPPLRPTPLLIGLASLVCGGSRRRRKFLINVVGGRGGDWVLLGCIDKSGIGCIGRGGDKK